MNRDHKILFGIIGILVLMLVLEYFLLTNKDDLDIKLPKTTIPQLNGKPLHDADD